MGGIYPAFTESSMAKVRAGRETPLWELHSGEGRSLKTKLLLGTRVPGTQLRNQLMMTKQMTRSFVLSSKLDSVIAVTLARTCSQSCFPLYIKHNVKLEISDILDLPEEHSSSL